MSEKVSYEPSIDQVEYTNKQLYKKETDLHEKDLPASIGNEEYFAESEDFEEDFSEGLRVETGSGRSFETVSDVERRIEGNRNVVKAFYEANKDRLHAIALEEDARRSHEAVSES